MPLNQVSNIRASEVYDAALDNTQAETLPVDIQGDLNMLRTMTRLVTGEGSWFNTPATNLSTINTVLGTLVSDYATHAADTSIHFQQTDIDHTNLLSIGTNTHANIDFHIASVLNPHGVTFTQIGAAALLHTHVAGEITDFSLAVANTSSVLANTSKVSAAGSISTHFDVDTQAPNNPSVGEVLKWSGSCWIPAPEGGGGGGGLSFASSIYTPAPSQILFTLPSIPAGKTLAFVNGIQYDQGLEFSVVGTTFTWNSVAAEFSLAPSDRLAVYYEV